MNKNFILFAMILITKLLFSSQDSDGIISLLSDNSKGQQQDLQINRLADLLTTQVTFYQGTVDVTSCKKKKSRLIQTKMPQFITIQSKPALDLNWGENVNQFLFVPIEATTKNNDQFDNGPLSKKICRKTECKDDDSYVDLDI